MAGAPVDQVAGYLTDLAAVPGVETVQSVARDTATSTTLVQVSWPGNGQSEASQDLVRRLRGVPPPDGGTVQIGGDSASTVDLIDAISAQLPLMALLVASVMLVLLFIAFGSVVLPVKAILANTVSIAASFGAVTWVFRTATSRGCSASTPRASWTPPSPS
ncbi:MAG: MMPL family transporter [Nocardioides sp.]